MSRSGLGIRDVIKDSTKLERPPSTNNGQASSLPYVNSGSNSFLKQHGQSTKNLVKGLDPSSFINDLRKTTDKFFLSGGKDENFLPEIKDKKVLGELRRIIGDQKKELDARSTTILALQKNFESLQTLCLGERTEKAKLQSKSELLMLENKDQSGELLQLGDKIAELEKIIEELQAEKKKLEKIRDEHIQLKITHETTQRQLEQKAQRVEQLEQDVAVQKENIAELRTNIAGKETELKDQEKIKVDLIQQIKEGEKLLDASSIESKKKDLLIEDRDTTIQQLRQEIVEWKNKYDNLSDQFNKKQSQLKESITDIEKERSAKREAQKELQLYLDQLEQMQLMLKAGDLTHDEQKKKVTEMNKRVYMLEQELKNERDENQSLTKELLDQKEQFKINSAQVYKEVSHYKESITKLEAQIKQLGIEKQQLHSNFLKQQDLHAQLEKDMRMIAPIVEEKDRFIQEQQMTIKQLKEQFERDKMAQREEYVRVFNRLKDELAGYKTNTKGKDGEAAGLQTELQNKITEAEKLKIENQQLQAQITALEDKIKKLINDNKDINELQNEVKSLKENLRKQDKEIHDLKIKNEDIESAYDRLKKELLVK